MQTGKIYKGDTLISGGGSNGKSAYELWLAAGNTGTMEDFLTSLKGDSGVSADYPIEIHNGLDSSATDAALAAAQGKVLDEKVTQLGQEITDLDEQINDEPGVNYEEGKCVKANGVIEDNAGWGLSDFVPYAQGNDVEWNYGGNAANTIVIQFYDNEKNAINGGYWSAGGSGGIKTITAAQIGGYAANAAFLRASYRLATESPYVKIGGTTAWTPSLGSAGIDYRLTIAEGDIASLDERADELGQKVTEQNNNGKVVGKNAFGYKTKMIRTDAIETSNQYITTDGTIVQQAGSAYRTYGPFVLNKGESIDIDVFGENICALAEISGNNVIPIYNIKAGNGENAFGVSYVADRDIELMICSSGGIGNMSFFWVRTILPTNGITPEAESFINVEWGIIKKYIDANGNLVTSNAYGVSSPIHLSAGDLLKFDLSFINVSFLASVNNGIYTPIYQGTRAIFDELSYYALEDIDVVLCGVMANEAKYAILSTSDKPLTKSQVESRMSSLLDYDISETRIVTIGRRNAYIDTNGGVHDYNGYYISSPIFIESGQKIESTFTGVGVAAISKVSDGVYTPVVNASGANTYQWVADEDCEIVLCGNTTLADDCEYTLTTYTDVKSVLDSIVQEGLSDFHLLNPYAGANYDNQVPAQTHEHCYDKGKLEKAYNRGIRLISCSHYIPSTPRYPFSDFDTPYQDYKSKQAVLDGDLEMVTRHTTGSIPTLNVNVGDVQTDDIPQIANAERAYLTDINGHFNILGLLWGSAGNALCNNELTMSPEDLAIKKNYSLESTTKFNQLLEDESMWQFGPRYAFGSINHQTSKDIAMTMLDRCPTIFKAMELFNQGYSDGWNQNFKDAYDSVLKAGYRIWGTAVVDWQDDWATWAFTTAEEKAEWEAKFLELSAEEQAEYGNAEGYYMATGRIQRDRGCNVLLMDGNYSGMTPSEKAKEGIKAYIAGRYYMSAWNTKSMKLITDHHLVTFKVSDIADKIVLVTGKVRMEYNNTDTINYVAKADDIFIRFEAYWNDGEFVYSNPVFVLL